VATIATAIEILRERDGKAIKPPSFAG
jgi:hypothetical protein